MRKGRETATAPNPEASALLGPALPSVEEVAGTTPRNEWGKVRELALRQLDRFVSFEPKVLRGDDPDAIHDMRVASRRLQQVFDLLYPAPLPRPLRKPRRKIQRCRRVLGEVRNCDVLLARVENTLTRKRTSRREVWTAVKHYLLQRRAESFQTSLRKLSKVNLATFYLDLKACLAPNGPSARVEQRSHLSGSPDELGSEQFYDRLGRSLEEVWRAFETQIADSQRDSRAPVIHGTRIAAKRLRYLIEVIHEFDVPGSAETLAWLRALQQHLGDWHDLEVLEQMIIEMVARPEFLREHLDIALGAERLVLRNRAIKKNYVEKYFGMTLDSGDYRRVQEWVGYLLSSPSAAFAKA